MATELHLSVFNAETISSDLMSIYIPDTLKLLYFVKKMTEHRYDIRISESCVDPNPLMVKRQDPENFTRFQMRERCALEIAAYVFNWQRIPVSWLKWQLSPLQSCFIRNKARGQ